MNKFKLYLTNTLSGIIELFEPIIHNNQDNLPDGLLCVSKKNNSKFQSKSKIKVNNSDILIVTMYVCGITPYDYAHLGHGRCYVTFDILYRLLDFIGYKVIYCRNFTDIDDKIIKKAEVEFQDPSKYMLLSDKFIDAYEQDMQKLNCLAPTCQPRVTENIAEIVHFIEILLNKGHAYISQSGVYYRVQSFKDYGKLSKRNLNELKVGARVEAREDKENPLDFALWKNVDLVSPGWQSPWGYGRPGWHIECSALIKKYLGITIDIHGGGMDLIFPHHENEIAQSRAAFDKPLAKYWVHNAFILLNKEKMSKSLGNFFTLRDVFAKFDPMLLRYYLLTHYYRSPIEFSFDDIITVSKSYQKLIKFFENIQSKTMEDLKNIYYDNNLLIELLEALLLDLNTPKFFGILFQNLKNIEQSQDIMEAVKALIKNILGLTLEPLIIFKTKRDIEITPEIQNLIDQREQARKLKDWAKADQVRQQLIDMGYEIHDKKIK